MNDLLGSVLTNGIFSSINLMSEYRYRICPNQTLTVAAYFHVKAADAYTQLISSDFKLPKNSSDTTDYDDMIDLFI
jgi:hypothetical protein